MSTPKPVTAEDILRQQYGWVNSLQRKVPALTALFNKAIKEGWTQDNFAAQLRNTAWFKTHNQAARNALTLQATDPAEYRNQIKTRTASIRKAADAAGIKYSNADLAGWSNASYVEGWGQDQILAKLSGQITDVDTETGLAQSLRELADANGVGNLMDDNFYLRAAKAILQNPESGAKFRQEIVNKAVSKYPQFADQLAANGDNGSMTVKDLASAYISEARNTLEDPSIDLNSNIINTMLTNLDAKDGKPVVKPFWQFQQDLRKTPEWKGTTAGKKAAYESASTFAKTFGLMG